MNQLELFSLNDVERLSIEVKKVKESSDNVRRGLFARHNELAKMYMDLHKKYEELCLYVNLQSRERLEELDRSA